MGRCWGEQAILRTSARYGWGIHANGDGAVALCGVETSEYAAFIDGHRRAP